MHFYLLSVHTQHVFALDAEYTGDNEKRQQRQSIENIDQYNVLKVEHLFNI